ncbi:hypothetical protein EV644_102448 [Kribbella orskensis]|uniref:DUF222 domain-containing protein n=1 Tax=Kribbella orskensis TaxID=2512216 RepID=A0ABY2BS48_9ACTN|nr:MULTISPECIES: hypothetical protein [Kribbella]TCN42916.1 hypothetical protein EV642_102289 [Kribbella sp. VKM Ac-2500]TCO29728.1 hypothetical protein EV644_102448 [Kribbella orskensis]
MFDGDVADLDATETLAWAAELHVLRTRAEVRLIELAQHFADLHPDPATVPGQVSLAGGERGVVYGGPGCPAIAEFAAAEFGAMIGRSAGSAAVFIGQSLALRHRLPRSWAQVRSGHGEPWKARTIATACLALSVDAAEIVDRRVASIIDTVTPVRLEKIVKAAIQQADPDAARAAAEARAKERGVWAGRTDDHGTTTLYVRAATGDVIHFKATIRQIADALAQLGDTDTLPQRKAKAIGIIADPALTNELLTVAHHLTPTTTPSTDRPDAGGADAATTSPPQPPHDSVNPDAAQGAAQATAHSECPHAAPAADQSVRPDAAQATVNAEPPDAWLAADHSTRSDAVRATVNAEPPGAWLAADHSTRSGAARATDDVGLGAGCGQMAATDGGASAGAGGAAEWIVGDEPGVHDEADRDPPHPGDPAYDRPSCSAGSPSPEPADGRCAETAEPARVAGPALDSAARREIARKLAAVKHGAYGSQSAGGAGRKPARTTLYVHITDETLLAGGGVARVERFGPVFAARLAELLGHDQIVVKPVVDLNDRLSVDAYEIPRRIRERVKLTHPVEQFVFGAAETTDSVDLDHIAPFDFSATGPPGQTSTDNLTPLRRYSHRVKTHGGWRVRRLDDGGLEWTTKHGFKFRVDHTGTHPLVDHTDASRPLVDR